MPILRQDANRFHTLQPWEEDDIDQLDARRPTILEKAVLSSNLTTLYQKVEFDLSNDVGRHILSVIRRVCVTYLILTGSNASPQHVSHCIHIVIYGIIKVVPMIRSLIIGWTRQKM